jgi:hypothetical protein
MALTCGFGGGQGRGRTADLPEDGAKRRPQAGPAGEAGGLKP